MFANEEAPTLQSVVGSGQLGFRHDGLATDGALDRAIEDPAELAVVEARGKAHHCRAPLCRDGLELFLSPLQNWPNLGKATKQEHPSSVSPTGGSLGAGPRSQAS
eukprot:3653647-Alexandrium_andersonii.AAC.1